MAAETLKEQLQKQQAQLTNDRSSFDPHWRELSDFINPRGSRFLVTDVNRDDRRNTKIVDPTATTAARTLSSGMMSGITSPARPWFKLATPDPDMMDYGPVKLWLEVVQRRMNEVFNKSISTSRCRCFTPARGITAPALWLCWKTTATLSAR